MDKLHCRSYCRTLQHNFIAVLTKFIFWHWATAVKKKIKISIGYQIKLLGKLCRWWVPLPFQDPPWSIFSGFSQFIIQTHTLSCFHLPEFLLTYQRAHKSRGDKFVSQLNANMLHLSNHGIGWFVYLQKRRELFFMQAFFLFPSCIKCRRLTLFSAYKVFF